MFTILTERRGFPSVLGGVLWVCLSADVRGAARLYVPQQPTEGVGPASPLAICAQTLPPASNFPDEPQQGVAPEARIAAEAPLLPSEFFHGPWPPRSSRVIPRRRSVARTDARDRLGGACYKLGAVPEGIRQTVEGLGPQEALPGSTSRGVRLTQRLTQSRPLGDG